jgi:hypothetical protein
MTLTRVYRYVRYSLIQDYLALGWYWDGTMTPGSHKEWSVVMEWLCDCPIREPTKQEKISEPTVRV